MHTTMALFQNMGLPELLIILFVVLLLFGSTKLPALARSLGSSVNEFKKGAKEGAEEDAKKSEDENADKGKSEKADKK